MVQRAKEPVVQPPFDHPADPASHTPAQDWLTICHSELAALATDREAREHQLQLLTHWSAALDTLLRHDHGAIKPSAPWANAPPRPPPAAAPPPPGSPEIDALRHRVAELEHRLAALEPAPHPA